MLDYILQTVLFVTFNIVIIVLFLQEESLKEFNQEIVNDESIEYEVIVMNDKTTLFTFPFDIDIIDIIDIYPANVAENIEFNVHYGHCLLLTPRENENSVENSILTVTSKERTYKFKLHKSIYKDAYISEVNLKTANVFN